MEFIPPVYVEPSLLYCSTICEYEGKLRTRNCMICNKIIIDASRINTCKECRNNKDNKDLVDAWTKKRSFTKDNYRSEMIEDKKIKDKLFSNGTNSKA